MSDATHPTGLGFLLAQVGGEASARFAERTKPLGITPAQAGVLRILGRRPSISQRDLADVIGAVPSRVVALIDRLQDAGLVTRTRSRVDRRNHELDLTDAGRATLGRLRTVAQEHERDLVGGLTPAQRAELAGLLGALAADLGLRRDVHPGYADRATGPGEGAGSARPVERHPA